MRTFDQYIKKSTLFKNEQTCLKLIWSEFLIIKDENDGHGPFKKINQKIEIK